MILKKIPILIDNYVWILVDVHGFCIIIDPGLSSPIIKEIQKKKWHPVAILLTHNHIDHTGGVKEIVKMYPKINVFGPDETKEYSVSKIVIGGDKIIILDRVFYVFFTPGHTLGHVSYYIEPYIFCGDTLFSAGCGRIYKEHYLEMYYSIKFISSLPKNTMLCCSHEYTLLNLNFAMFLLPNDVLIRLYSEKIKFQLKNGRSSLPSYIFLEKNINVFLRTKEDCLKKALGIKKNCTSFEVFTKLRIKKDFWS